MENSKEHRQRLRASESFYVCIRPAVTTETSKVRKDSEGTRREKIVGDKFIEEKLEK